MTEPSELVERLAAVVDPRYSAEFVGNIVRANWPDIHAALSAMTDPLAMVRVAFTYAYAAGYKTADETSRSCVSAMDEAWAEFLAILAIDPATLEVNHATD